MKTKAKMTQIKREKEQKPKKDADEVLKEQNASVKASADPVVEDKEEDAFVPAKGKKIVKVLGKKKTVKDNKGDEWEVVDKRDTYLKEKAIDTDSDGSELSMD